MGHFPTEPNRPYKRKPPPHQGRKNPNKDFYNGQRWRNLRAAFIRENPLCVYCDRNGIIKAGKVVDHIEPINEGGEKYNPENLQTLCHPCHNSKSGRESQAAQKRKKEDDNNS